jgi:hypothetical protein
MAPHFKSKMGPEVDAVPVDAVGLQVWESTQSQRFQRNMIKAQWAVAQIVRHDMVESIVKWFDHELYCILGFLACSLETRTVKARKKDDPNRKIVDVLVASKFAVPNLVVAFRMLDELKSHWPDECLPDYVPSQLGKLMRSGKVLVTLHPNCSESMYAQSRAALIQQWHLAGRLASGQLFGLVVLQPPMRPPARAPG